MTDPRISRVFAAAVFAFAFTATVGEAAVADGGDLQVVVALFRHGVRAPLKGFADTAKDHSKQDWPGLAGAQRQCR